MHNIRLFNRIGTKVLFTFLVAIIPLIGVIASLNLHIRLDAMAFARNQMLRTAFEASAEQDRFLAELREMLRRLASLEETRTLTLPQLEDSLRRVCQEKPALENIFLCNTEGRIVAAARAGSVGLNVSRRKYFKDALGQGGLAFGEYVISQVTGEPVMHFSLPVRGEDGTIVGVLVASLDLARPIAVLTDLDVPRDGFLEMIDGLGRRLWRWPASAEHPAGQGQSPAVTHTLFGQRRFGTLVGTDTASRETLAAFRQLRVQRNDPDPYGVLVVGLPVATAMAEARERILFSTAISAFSVIVAIVVAMILGHKVIVGRLRILADLVSDVEQNRVCLLPRNFGTDEIGRLGRRFSDLSRELHEKNLKLAETMIHLSQEKNRLEAVVGQLGEAQDELVRRASFDDLTGLRNRRSFNERLREEFSLWRRYGTPLSLVLLDVDDFKRVNDSFGHWAGDETLRAVANRVKRRLREADEAYRVGGEEFALILPHTRGDDARGVAERVRQAMAEAMIPLSDGGRVHVTVSLGLAECHAAFPAQKDLYTAADRALYRAKTLGKNRVAAWEHPPEA
jgi:diguanylate cyclase (GGDEF)-like protein